MGKLVSNPDHLIRYVTLGTAILGTGNAFFYPNAQPNANLDVEVSEEKEKSGMDMTLDLLKGRVVEESEFVIDLLGSLNQERNLQCGSLTVIRCWYAAQQCLLSWFSRLSIHFEYCGIVIVNHQLEFYNKFRKTIFRNNQRGWIMPKWW